jgi:hypothetical protein
MSITKSILTIIITIAYLCATAQCLVTQTEYKELIGELEDIDPIVGLWYLSGETTLYEKDSLISHGQDPFLDYWFIVPEGSAFKVCHTDYTDEQNFDAKFTRIKDSSYKYHVVYGSKGEAYSDATLMKDVVLNNGSEKQITYKLSPPIEQAMTMGATEDQRIEWTFYWTPIDEKEFFDPSVEGQEMIYNEMDSLYSEKEWTESELKNLMNTSKNEFTNHIRNRLNSDSFFEITGCKDFPKEIKKDKFVVISVNELFTKRRSYFILFDQYDDNVWRVDFKIDEHNKLKEIISFNKSDLHNEKTIALLKRINTMDRYDFWR